MEKEIHARKRKLEIKVTLSRPEGRKGKSGRTQIYPKEGISEMPRDRRLLSWDEDSYPERGLCADMPELTDYLYPDVIKGRIGFDYSEVELSKPSWGTRVSHRIAGVFGKKAF